MELPPLAMDSMLEDSPSVDAFKHGNQFLGQPGLLYDYYREDMDEELCQDAFMSFKPEQAPTFDHPTSAFEFPSGHVISADDFDHVDHGLKMSISQQDMLQSNVQKAPGSDDQTSQLQATTQESQYLPAFYGEVEPEAADQHAPDEMRQHPLLRFDPRYHQVLQEQLGTQASQFRDVLPSQTNVGTHDNARQEGGLSQESWTHIDLENEEAVRSALLTATAIDDLGSQSTKTQQQSQGQPQYVFSQAQSPPAQWLSPLAMRPALHSHHSFPGIHNSDLFQHDQSNISSHLVQGLLDPEIHVSQPQPQQQHPGLPTTSYSFDHFDSVPSHHHGRQISISMVPGSFNRAFSEPVPDLEPVTGSEGQHSSGHVLPSQAVAAEHGSDEPFSQPQNVPDPLTLSVSEPVGADCITGRNGDDFVEIKMEDV
jgi:hypothetical protein